MNKTQSLSLSTRVCCGPWLSVCDKSLCTSNSKLWIISNCYSNLQLINRDTWLGYSIGWLSYSIVVSATMMLLDNETVVFSLVFLMFSFHLYKVTSWLMTKLSSFTPLPSASVLFISVPALFLPNIAIFFLWLLPLVVMMPSMAHPKLKVDYRLWSPFPPLLRLQLIKIHLMPIFNHNTLIHFFVAAHKLCFLFSLRTKPSFQYVSIWSCVKWR